MSSTRNIFIDSVRDRQIGQSTTDFQIYLPNVIGVGGSNRKIRVVQASIENTSYTFKITGNKLYYYLGQTSGSSFHSITLPTDRFFYSIDDGNPNTPDDLISTMTALFSDNGHDIVAGFLSEEGRLTLKNNTGQDLRIVSSDEWESDSQQLNKANTKLGFISDLRNLNIPSGETLVAGGIARLKVSAFFITASLVSGSSQVANPLIGTQRPIIARVPVLDNTFGATCYYQSFSTQDYIHLVGENINEIQIQVYDDELDIPINLHGGNVSIHLELSDK